MAKNVVFSKKKKKLLQPVYQTMGNSYISTCGSLPFRGHEWERVTDVHINSWFHERLRQKV